MIFDNPTIRIAGDSHIIVYFGDELNIELNFMAHNLAKKVGEGSVPGILETVVHFASLLIKYDPETISLGDLKMAIAPLIAHAQVVEDIEIDSRLVTIPILFFDPWTRECIEDYCARIRQKEFDLDLLVRQNRLSNVEQIKTLYSATEHWVATVGFRPGLPMCLPLDPRCRLLAPKYDPPRTWTPVGSLGIGGAALSFYAAPSAGGYQLFARTPVPIWDMSGRFEPFKRNACLLRPSDRIRMRPISREEYDEIEHELEDGTYLFNIVEYQKFSVGSYKKWLAGLDLSKRFLT